MEALRRADTTVLALARAERVKSLLFTQLRHEDRWLLRGARAAAGEESGRSGNAPLTMELHEILAHDHARITAAVAAARDAGADASDDELGLCDWAVAALSQHAAVMSTRAYPMARRVLPRPERAAIGLLTGDLHRAERAMLHLERALRGAAGEDPADRERLWADVERTWRHHVTDEEPLIRRVAPLLGPARVAS